MDENINNNYALNLRNDKINEELLKLRWEIQYNTNDYAIDYLIARFKEGEFFINAYYQRNFVWDSNRKCLFIESILLGYPIPFMFFSQNDDSRFDIIDGAQRTSTLEEFFDGDLILSNLKKLTEMNGLKYKQLPLNVQRRFRNTTLRVIVLSDNTSLDARKEIFNRINTTSLPLKTTETRRGTYAGPFIDFMSDCAQKQLFKKLCPISENSLKRYEHIELITRFFAFANNYQNYGQEMSPFLDEFVEKHMNNFDKNAFETEFDRMLSFVDKYFKNGFKKTANGNFVPRARFESISVGVALALREDEDLTPFIPTDEWSDITDKEKGKKFRFHTTTHASNNKSRVIGRIEFVKNMLLYGKETN
ncbi:MAG: DUF262 domain-containing protein [Deltaproteobacteria bacterium]|jgi:uncharacterized protein with ParB-like and HNH nuclease domain|nr:DUF262 domain-containing protein [Deltaproteobacteria bacterium]